MILELVTFKSPAGWDRARVVEDAKATIAKRTANEALIRKHFLLGLGDAEGTGAGVSVWPAIEAAQKAHDEAWRARVRKRTGGDPAIRYFDLFLLIDDAQGAVTEVTADGRVNVLDRA